MTKRARQDSNLRLLPPEDDLSRVLRGRFVALKAARRPILGARAFGWIRPVLGGFRYKNGVCTNRGKHYARLETLALRAAFVFPSRA